MTWSPDWGYELDLLELGMRFERGCFDSGSSVEHRLARANGQRYGSPPRHWAWEAARLGRVLHPSQVWRG